ncbi:hypothetical protein CGZ75_05805 [Paenibacillus herberti]|uniref:Uncharacterized protein n=1 Tax=Paenibacillus herberti TaxID=1619309 RepID=A0A229P2A7_9BACL|nr:hypothetical protein CGZ75_05805 [Paenibacillus herberti]
MFKKATIDHDVNQEVNSTSNLVFTFEVRCSCRFAYIPLLLLLIHTTFSVLNGDLFELALIEYSEQGQEVRARTVNDKDAKKNVDMQM